MNQIPQPLLDAAHAHLQARFGGGWEFDRYVGRVERRIGLSVELGPHLLEFVNPSGRVAQASISDDGTTVSAWEV